MAHSHDWDELQYTWAEWRRAIGGSKNMRDLYQQLVTLTNEAAQLNSKLLISIKLVN